MLNHETGDLLLFSEMLGIKVHAIISYLELSLGNRKKLSSGLRHFELERPCTLQTLRLILTVEEEMAK